LEQQDLDKPFTGGLGSYKLYVMVAYHLHRHLSLGGSDRPGEILLSFLFRFGHVKGHNVDELARTELSQDLPLQEDDGSSADLANVFQLEQCIHLFHCCWARLWRWMRPIGKHDEHKSLLADVVDASRLHLERQKCIQKAETSVDKLKLSTNNAESRKRLLQQNAPGRVLNSRSRSFPAEMTAAQLMAGYSVDSLQGLPAAKRTKG